nr:hypothetical protein B0A51_14129 [Rachicladosporium sp. CCFEE 5018]
MASSLGNTMRAASWKSTSGGLGKNIYIDNAYPLPKGAKSLPAGSTLIKVAYASLNPVDLKLAEAPVIGRFLSKGVPGSDFSGTVVQSTQPNLKPGDEVYGYTELPAFGACAEYVIGAEANVVNIPRGVSLEQAATLGIAGLTAYQTIAPFVKAGDRVLINGGSGGVGVNTIQIGKALGCHITATCSGANVDFLKTLGADEVIDYRTNDVVATLTRTGVQFDHIIDNVFADAKLYWSAHKYLQPGKQYVTIAGSPQFSVIKNILTIYLLPAFLGGGKRHFGFVTCTSKVEEHEIVANFVKEGKVKVEIEKVYPLEETGKAYERLASGRVRGKLVVKVA